MDNFDSSISNPNPSNPSILTPVIYPKGKSLNMPNVLVIFSTVSFGTFCLIYLNLHWHMHACKIFHIAKKIDFSKF
jgi:hypothetical protein